MTKKKIVYVIAIMLVMTACSNSVKIAQNNNIKSNKIELKKHGPVKIMSGDIKFGPEARNEILPYNVEAAFNLASELTGNYIYYPWIKRDSVVKAWKASNIPFSMKLFSDSLGIQYIYFFQIDRLCNMIRTEIEKVDVNNPKIKTTAYGYGLVHHFREKSNYPIYDPALLTSIQRAFAAVENDSNMYSFAKDEYRVFPNKTLVICGIDFVNDTTLTPWSLFSNKETRSYDAIENIFEEVRNLDNYTCYDTESRDSIYSLFNLKIIDNFKAPNPVELSALNRLEVNNYISGEFKRTESGAKITLVFCEISNNTAKVLKSVSENIDNDDIDAFRNAIKKAAKELMLP